MIIRSRRSGVRCVALAALLAELGCGLATNGRVDSESHFLECVVDADCAAIAGASCVSGACSVGDAPVESGAIDADLPRLQPGASPGLDACSLPVGTEFRNQEALDGLEGCTVISGDLAIAFMADLRPLHALQRVEGSLSIWPTLRRQTSLEGLESLEYVAEDLRLQSLSVTSLASLARLRSIGSQPRSDGLTLQECSELTDLSGLEGVAELSGLNLLSNPKLTTLSPISLSSRVDRLVLEDNPLLTDLAALRGVSRITSLILTETPLENLDGFGDVRQMGELDLLSNERLTDASALSQLQALQALYVTDNPLLGQLGLSVYASGLKQVWISHNAALGSVSGLDHFTALDLVTVQDNPQLSGLSLVGLQSLPTFQLIRNSLLTQLDLGSAIVRDLVVVSNASLAPSQVEGLAGNAWQSKVAGNQGQATGLDPCPFENDGYCDAAPQDTLCAEGTDLDDCNAELSRVDR